MGRIPESLHETPIPFWLKKRSAKCSYKMDLHSESSEETPLMDCFTPWEFHHSKFNLKVKREFFRRWVLHLSQSRPSVRAYTDAELLAFRKDLLDQIPDPYPPGYLD